MVDRKIMKAFFVLLCFTISSFATLFGQNLKLKEDTNSKLIVKKDAKTISEKLQKSNELRINLVLYVTAFGRKFNFYSIDYQRILSDRKSIGFSFGGRFKFNSTVVSSNDDLPFLLNFHAPDIAFLPYYREYYFSNQRTVGVFIEINGLVNYYKHNHVEDGIDKGYHNPWGFGVGFAFGYKYLSKDNWFFEILAGGGFNTQYILHPRAGILVGRRF